MRGVGGVVLAARGLKAMLGAAKGRRAQRPLRAVARRGLAAPALTFALVAGLAAGGATGAPTAGAAAAQSSAGSLLDGVFTAQASRGERTFSDVCAACHDTGEFSGGRFRISWVGRPVGELFETISTLMPEADPGSLSPAEYAAIVAYLLQVNNYPAGDTDLPTNVRALGQLEIVSPPAQ